MTANGFNSPDDFAIVLKPLAAVIVVVCLGPVGIAAAIVPWIAAWYLGSLTACLWSLGISMVSIIGLLVSGRLQLSFSVWLARLRDPLLQLDLQALGFAWLDLARSPWVTTCLVAAGLGVGAVARLIFEDSLNSGVRGLVRRSIRPAPIAAGSKKQADLSLASAGDRTLLGVNWRTGRQVHITDADLNNHVLNVGTTGRGKTVTNLNLVESHIERGLPVLFLDGKGDVRTGAQIKAFAESHGRKAYLFHQAHVGHHPESCAYDPFTGSDYSALADMVVTLHDWSEPYYQVLARGYMQTVFKVALAIREPVDLLSIQKLMSVSAMVQAIRKHARGIPDAQALIAEINDQRGAEKAGIEGLRSLIRNLGRSSAAHLFDTGGDRPVLRLAQARREGAIVYFALPALTFPDLSKAIGKLVINDARLTLSQSDGPWLIVLDEISTFVGQQVLHLVNQGRSFGARVVLAGQSFADLEASVTSGGAPFLSQVLASVNSLIVHQLNSPADAELAAQYAGTFQKVEITAQVVEQAATGVGSARSTREFQVRPDDFKELETAEAYLISKRLGNRIKISGRLSRIYQKNIFEIETK